MEKIKIKITNEKKEECVINITSNDDESLDVKCDFEKINQSSPSLIQGIISLLLDSLTRQNH